MAHTRLRLVGLALLSVSTMSAAREEQSITVSQRPEALVCAGVCPNNDVTVWADGRVLVVQHHPNEPDRFEHFQVTRAEAAQFRRIMLPYQSAADQSGFQVRQNRLNSEPIRQALWSIHLYVDGRRRD